MSKTLKAPVMALYHGAFEPLLAFGRRKSRLAAFPGLGPEGPPAIPIYPHARVGCGPNCGCDKGFAREVVERYARVPLTNGASEGAWLGRAVASVARRASLTPMVIDLDRYETAAAFEAHVKERSSRTLPKARKAAGLGYVAHRFPLRRHVYDVHAVKTSARTRAAGPVLDYWLLKPEDIAVPASKPIGLGEPACKRHWVMWWGVFLPKPGHMQGKVKLRERLVAYVKLTCIGDLLHYTDLMGHADHLDDGVMTLLHLEVIRWLIESGDPWAVGVRAVLYGAAEHGREGLLTWKKRAGFDPARLIVMPPGG